MGLRPVLRRTNTEMQTTVYHKTNLKVVLQTSMGNYDLFLLQCTVLSVDFRIHVVCSAEHGRLFVEQCQLTTGRGGGGCSYEGRQIMKTCEECMCCRESASAIQMA